MEACIVIFLCTRVDITGITLKFISTVVMLEARYLHYSHVLNMY